MLTLIIMPVFKGTRKEFTKGLMLTLMLDCFIFVGVTLI